MLTSVTRIFEEIGWKADYEQRQKGKLGFQLPFIASNQVGGKAMVDKIIMLLLALTNIVIALKLFIP